LDLINPRARVGILLIQEAGLGSYKPKSQGWDHINTRGRVGIL
jgi:hypothetical protein